MRKPRVSLVEFDPEIAAQWHPTKNGDLTPEMVGYASKKAVWWRCHQGHVWQGRIQHRTGRGSRCPTCRRFKIVTLAEFAPEVAAQWHPTKNGNLTPHMVARGSNRLVWWVCENGHEWKTRVALRAKYGCGCPTCSQVRISLAEFDPEAAAQWHPTKNGDLTPHMVSRRSSKVAWWVCKDGHEWQAPICHRTYGGPRCPECAARRRAPSWTDTHPEVAAGWHPTKNGDLDPRTLPASSGLRVWWVCERGHEWQAQVRSRVAHGTGCPTCKQERPHVRTTVAQGFPEIAAQWHPTKNGDLTPDLVASASTRRIWWTCEQGHEWETTPANRTKQGTGCPACRSIPEVSLAEFAPEIAAQWHPNKNGDLTPDLVARGRNRVAWWRCGLGHEWGESVLNRTMRRTGCPTCSRLERTLAQACPDLAAQWHPTKNGKLTPERVSCNASDWVWWRCERGHAWSVGIRSRVVYGTGCPECCVAARI